MTPKIYIALSAIVALTPALAQMTGEAETLGTSSSGSASVAPEMDAETQEGVVAEIDAGSGQLKLATARSTIPMTFHFTEKTTFVDVKDKPFERGTLKLGRLVTVHYLPQPDELRATKIVVGAPPTLIPSDEKSTLQKEIKEGVPLEMPKSKPAGKSPDE
jgi:hypothetical protein